MPLPSTQDLDARFAVFLNPIRDLTKNWEVDIAKYLEEYLEELSEVQITFDGGDTMMNFAEAAMLIQGSATVYSKKVEFLWQMVLQMLELLSSKRKFATQEPGADDDDAPAGAAGRGGKNALANQTVNFQRLDAIGEGRNIILKDDDSDEDDTDDFGQKRSFAFLPATPLHLVEKESEKSKNRVNLYLNNRETYGRKDDFRLNRSYMTPWGLLCLDLPSELMQGWVATAPPFTPTPDQDQALEGLPMLPLGAASDSFLPPPGSPPSPIAAMDDDDGAGLDLPPEPLAMDEPAAVEMEEVQEKDPPEVSVREFGRQGLRRRTAPEEVADVSAVPLREPWQPSDPYEQCPPPRPIRAGRLRRPPPCHCHGPPPQKRNRKRKKSPEEDDPDKLQPIDQHILKHLPDLANNNIKTALLDGTRADMHPALRDEVMSEEATRAALLHRDRALAGHECKAATDAVIQDQDEAEADDGLPPPLADDGAPASDGEGEEDDHGGGGVLELLDPHTGLEDEGGGAAAAQHNRERGVNLCETLQYEPDGEYEALVQQWVTEYIVNAQDYIASSELTRRVNRWRTRITPFLAKEEERQNFDIHSYGSKILNKFDNVSEEVPFTEVVAGLDRSEVARVFLSSLMLSNTYNVEPIESEPGDFAMDCLSLKLLSRTRHHEEMQEYVAPSQHGAGPAVAHAPPVTTPRPPEHQRQQRARGGKRGKVKGRSNKRPLTPTSSESDSSSDESDAIPRGPVPGSPPLSNGSLSPLEAARVDEIMTGFTTTDLTCGVADQRLSKRPKGPVASTDR